MRISHGTRITNINATNGYGYATVNMYTSLRRLGHKIRPNDGVAPVEIWFDQPHHWKFRQTQYKVGYHPWESTKLRDGWVDIMNECDEIWTPSPLIADWYREDGVERPIYVYEHGVEPIWAPKQRNVDDGVLKFLHVGGEAGRKAEKRTHAAFVAAFPDRNDVRMTFKRNLPQVPDRITRKLSIINQRYALEELVDLFYGHHVYVYPSYGEGFGLTPLQAMATGMPTITVPAWAPYSKYLDPELSLPSKLKNSPWQSTHPGKMFHPDFDVLVDTFRFAADNYDKIQDFAHTQVPGIQKKYDWGSLTKEVFDGLSKRL